MARVAPTTPTAAPTPPIQRGDRATFSSRVDQTITYLTGAPAEIYGIALNAYNNALDAFASATAANTSAGTAGTAATNAGTYATQAMGYRDSAQGYATAAQTSAAAAASSATGLTATSTTSNTLGLGAKTFSGASLANKQFTVNIRASAVDPTDATRYVTGPVTAYTNNGASSSLTITADDFGGTGSASNWNISVTGQRGAVGATGSLSGGNLTGALNEKTATDIASSATPDIWSAAGNYFGMTGTATITGFPAAPQAGAFRTFIARGAFAMNNSANLDIQGGSFTAAVGDQIEVRAETTTLFRVTRRRADGTSSAVIPPYQNAIVLDTSGPFIPTVTGWHEITLFGAGGSGGSSAIAANSNKVATGGGAGGICRATRWLVAGQTYMFTSGAGVVAKGVSPGSANGVDGGVTTFTGTGVATMTANGGKGGKFAAAGPLTGGDGGTAAGGDFNYTGGRGGNITGTSTGIAATGAGAVGLFGVGRNGGDITHSTASVSSGGGSPGGDGGAVTSTAGPAASGGGGMGGTAATVSTAVAGAAGKAGVPNAPNLFLANAAGTNGVTNSGNPGVTAAAGAGTGGTATTAAGFTSANGGFFAGSGGTVITDTNSLVNAGMAAGGDYGGGSGGIVYYTGSGVSHGGATSGGKCLIRFN